MSSHEYNYSINSEQSHSTTNAVAKADNIEYPSWKVILWQVSSTILTGIFLLFLMLRALIHAAYHCLKRDKELNIGLNQTNSDVYHSENEKKLVPNLSYYFTQYGLEIELFNLITKDGFVIRMERVIDPDENTNQRNQRSPLLLIHGLLQSSGSFCSSGKDSLAYFLFKSGYDVWLGNNRCGFDPKHMFLDPSDYKMWQWDINDMAKYDLTSMIDHVLSNNNSMENKVSIIAHSQGTSQTFLALYNDKANLNPKVKNFIALSPAVFGGELLNERLFIRIISKLITLKFFFGIKAFLPIMMTMRRILIGYKIFGFLSYTMFHYLFDWNDSLWDKEIRNNHFLFSPVYVSINLMSWWLNNSNGLKSGKSILNSNEQWFDESSPNILLVIPRKDKLVNGELLKQHFEEFEKKVYYNILSLSSYSHLDVLWSKTVIQDIGEPILSFLHQS